MIRKYKCGYCGHEFEANATKSLGALNEKTNRRKNSQSNQIKCPNCLNLLPTWERQR